MGFVPQVVDLNGDGITDILSGSYTGDYRGRTEVFKDESGKQLSEIFVYYRKKDGSFEPRVRIATCHVHSVVMPVDWDGDGDYDLVTAARSFEEATPNYGQINYMENTGSKTNPVFESRVNLIPEMKTKDGKDLLITSAEAWDWDGDGLLDILAGNEWGAIMFFKNDGTKSKPHFSPDPEFLAGKSTVGMSHKEKLKVLEEIPWGSRLALHIRDWDGDGVADILAGDSKTITLTKELRFANASESDMKRFEEAEMKMAEMQTKMREMSEGVNYQEMSEDDKKAYIEKMNAFRKDYEPYQNVIYNEFPERIMHGYVWVFKGIRE